MIDGITVLNKIEVMEEPDWITKTLVIISVLLIISLGLTMSNKFEKLGVILVLTSMAGIFSLAYISAVTPQEKTGRYQYEVIIEDNVSLTEVYEYYDVIEHRGDIWILEDLGQH